jgi:hypothetical protein
MCEIEKRARNLINALNADLKLQEAKFESTTGEEKCSAQLKMVLDEGVIKALMYVVTGVELI